MDNACEEKTVVMSIAPRFSVTSHAKGYVIEVSCSDEKIDRLIGLYGSAEAAQK
jgi:hypothetical protein